MKRFRGGLVFKAHRLCVSLNSRLESNKEEEKEKKVNLWALWNGVERRVVEVVLWDLFQGFGFRV